MYFMAARNTHIQEGDCLVIDKNGTVKPSSLVSNWIGRSLDRVTKGQRNRKCAVAVELRRSSIVNDDWFGP